VELRQVRDEGQPESSPFVPPTQAAVELYERLEEARDVGSVDPDPGVLNAEVNRLGLAVAAN